MFFDVDGVFHWQKIPSGENEAVVLDFDQLRQTLVISDSVDVDFENVKNNIIVYGRLLDNGKQVMATVSDTLSTSPFNISSIALSNKSFLLMLSLLRINVCFYVLYYCRQ